MLPRRLLVYALLLVSLVLAGPGPLRAQVVCVAGGEGIGGTGRAPRPGGSGEGIGGTGRAPVRQGSGAEGIGGTGLVGTITAFGSICVNGLEVDLEAGTRIEIDGRSASAEDLALGQLVEVEARGDASRLEAERISVTTTVAGPLTTIDVRGGRLEVLGQRIALRGRPVLWDSVQQVSLDATDLKRGDFVKVSGLRRSDGVVVASRIERSRPEVPRVVGPVEAFESGSVRIGGLRVLASRTSPTLAPGRVVRAAGPVANGTLTPSGLQIDPEIPFDGRLPRLSIEGFVQSAVPGERFRLGNLEIDVSSFASDPGSTAVALDARVRVLGQLQEGARLAPAAIEIQQPGTDVERWIPLGGTSSEGADVPSDEIETRSPPEERGDLQDREDLGIMEPPEPDLPEPVDPPADVLEPELPEGQPDPVERPDDDRPDDSDDRPDDDDRPEDDDRPDDDDDDRPDDDDDDRPDDDDDDRPDDDD